MLFQECKTKKSKIKKYTLMLKYIFLFLPSIFILKFLSFYSYSKILINCHL